MQDSGFISAQINRRDLGTFYQAECVGEVSRTPAPSPTHQWIVQRLLLMLASQENDEFVMLQAPTDLYLSKKQVRQPDLMIIHKNRKHIITTAGVVGPPNIIIEVLSETSDRLDKEVKFKNYQKLNVNEYWIVDPDQKQILQYEWIAGNYTNKQTYHIEETISSKQFKNVSIQLRHIFRLV